MPKMQKLSQTNAILYSCAYAQHKNNNQPVRARQVYDVYTKMGEMMENPTEAAFKQNVFYAHMLSLLRSEYVQKLQQKGKPILYAVTSKGIEKLKSLRADAQKPKEPQAQKPKKPEGQMNIITTAQKPKHAKAQQDIYPKPSNDTVNYDVRDLTVAVPANIGDIIYAYVKHNNGQKKAGQLAWWLVHKYPKVFAPELRGVYKKLINKLVYTGQIAVSKNDEYKLIIG